MRKYESHIILPTQNDSNQNLAYIFVVIYINVFVYAYL